MRVSIYGWISMTNSIVRMHISEMHWQRRTFTMCTMHRLVLIFFSAYSMMGGGWYFRFSIIIFILIDKWNFNETLQSNFFFSFVKLFKRSSGSVLFWLRLVIVLWNDLYLLLLDFHDRFDIFPICSAFPIPYCYLLLLQ